MKVEDEELKDVQKYIILEEVTTLKKKKMTVKIK